MSYDDGLEALYQGYYDGTTQTAEQIMQVVKAMVMTADHIKAGTIDARLVTVKSQMSPNTSITLDGTGIVAENNGNTTFSIDVGGNAYFSGAIEASTVTGTDIVGGTVTGSLIRTAETGRRIEMSGSTFASLDGDTLDGCTLDGSTGQLLWYTNDVLKGGMFRDTTSVPGINQMYIYDQHAITVSTPFVSLGDPGGDIHLYGSVSFMDSNSTNAVGDHNHGIPDGTELRKADGGTITWNASGGHSHTL